MESVAAYSPRAPVRRHSVRRCELRDIRVKRGVDTHDLRPVDAARAASRSASAAGTWSGASEIAASSW